MKIAVTYDNGTIFQHFGKTSFFKVYTVEDNKVIDAKIIDTGEAGHGALVGLLKGLNVDTLICGGIGPGAVNMFAGVGIQVFAGVDGDADTAVEAFLNNALTYSSQPTCDHHGEEHIGECGEHGCGSHSEFKS